MTSSSPELNYIHRAEMYMFQSRPRPEAKFMRDPQQTCEMSSRGKHILTDR